MAAAGFCREGLVFLRQRKIPSPTATSTPMIAAPTAIPATAPVDRECELDFDESVCRAPPAAEEDVEMAPVAVGDVPY